MEERKDQPDHDAPAGDIARRDFVAHSVDTHLAATADPAAASLGIIETNVGIETPDGTCEAVFLHLLPAAAQRPVQLHERLHLREPELGERELSLE